MHEEQIEGRKDDIATYLQGSTSAHERIDVIAQVRVAHSVVVCQLP